MNGSSSPCDPTFLDAADAPAARFAAAWITACTVSKSAVSSQDSVSLPETFRLPSTISNPTPIQSFSSVFSSSFPSNDPLTAVDVGDVSDNDRCTAGIETACVALSQAVFSCSSKNRLVILVKLYRLLDQVLIACKKRLRNNQETENVVHPIALDDLIAFARRIRCHVRAPPEYNDPTGADPFCVPGYFFPCPDRLMMSRSALFYSELLRAVPPIVTFQEDKRSASIVWVVLHTSTPRASIMFTINNAASWALYNVNQKPYLTGPGFYIVRAYAQAEGFYMSEVTVAEIDVPPPQSGDVAASLSAPHPPPTTVALEPSLKKQVISDHPTVLSTIVQRQAVALTSSRVLPTDLQSESRPSSVTAQKDLVPAAETTKTVVPAQRAKSAPSSASAKFGGLFLGDTGESDDDEESE